MQLKDSLTGANKPVRANAAGIAGADFISIYACGITPYSAAHVGHARTYVVFDVLKRALEARGERVRLVRNITDIDDKIIATSAAEGIAWHELAARHAADNRVLMQATGIEVPEEPAASHYLEDIFGLVRALIERGLAYVASSGDVLYRVSGFDGALLMPHKEGALRSEQGATRVDASGKEDLRDFALWKAMPADAVGFESPWGWGRPGWHIECSAMIASLFGGSVDIHGGGVDLKFPHHQAEIMQSEPVFGRPLADIWMHNGSVTSAGQKMSKSLGNFVTWRAALDEAESLAPGRGGELLRYALLQAHWQKPLDWSDKLLATSHAELLALTEGLDAVPFEADAAAGLLAVLDENLNTPAAMTWLKTERKAQRLPALSAGLAFLGIDPGAWARAPRSAVPTLSAEAVAELQARREQARAARDWALADSLRDTLKAHGVEVNDRPVRG